MSSLTQHALIRDATADDAPACAAIYSPYVTDTCVTFELTPPTAQEMAERITCAQRDHAWIVMQHHENVIGYAYGGTFRSRAAYRWTYEVSVYLDRDRRRSGAGRALYSHLLPRLAARGMHTAVACMTLPNDASLALHRSLGFENVGTMRAVGHEHGAWHDVAWAQRDLTPMLPPSHEQGTVTHHQAPDKAPSTLI